MEIQGLVDCKIDWGSKFLPRGSALGYVWRPTGAHASWIRREMCAKPLGASFCTHQIGIVFDHSREALQTKYLNHLETIFKHLSQRAHISRRFPAGHIFCKPAEFFNCTREAGVSPKVSTAVFCASAKQNRSEGTFRMPL
jgi:hypothetical protein